MRATKNRNKMCNFPSPSKEFCKRQENDNMKNLQHTVTLGYVLETSKLLVKDNLFLSTMIFYKHL